MYIHMVRISELIREVEHTGYSVKRNQHAWHSNNRGSWGMPLKNAYIRIARCSAIQSKDMHFRIKIRIYTHNMHYFKSQINYEVKS